MVDSNLAAVSLFQNLLVRSVNTTIWAVVGAQLVDGLLRALEIRHSYPVIGKLKWITFVYCQLNWKDGNKEKEARNVQFFLKNLSFIEIIKVWTIKSLWPRASHLDNFYRCVSTNHEQLLGVMPILKIEISDWFTAFVAKMKVKSLEHKQIESVL